MKKASRKMKKKMMKTRNGWRKWWKRKRERRRLWRSRKVRRRKLRRRKWKQENEEERYRHRWDVNGCVYRPWKNGIGVERQTSGIGNKLHIGGEINNRSWCSLPFVYPVQVCGKISILHIPDFSFYTKLLPFFLFNWVISFALHVYVFIIILKP